MLPSVNVRCAFSISDEREWLVILLTPHQEIVGCGVPIILEKCLTVDLFAALLLLPPLEKTALHVDLDPHLGCRRCISTH